MESSRTSSRTHFEVLGLGFEALSPWPWPRSLKSLALASKPQVLKNCHVLGSRTALLFESLKFSWKMLKTSRKICEHLFCFPQLEHRRSQRGGDEGTCTPNCDFTNDKNVPKILLFLQFQFLLCIFLLATITNNNMEDQGPRAPFQFNFCQPI